jgi:hypothetical protein
LDSLVKVVILRRPYASTIPDDVFSAQIEMLAYKRAESVREKHMKGVYSQPNFGMCLLDPTCPISVSSDQAVLALIAIGEKGLDYVENAVAKACEHRDTGVDCGILVYVQPHRLADGRFRYGHSACVDGTFVGASALEEVQDRFEAIVLAAEFNLMVVTERGKWVAGHQGEWFNEQNAPAPEYAAVAARIGA